jgi:glycosyltransferase involved in cell wall biosynthesis
LLRIGYDVTPLAPPRTGVGNYAFSLLKHLLIQDSDAEFAALSTGRRAPNLDSLVSPHDRARLMLHRHVPVPTRLMYQAWNTVGKPCADNLIEGADIYHATNYVLPPLKSARGVVTIYDLAFLRHPEWCSPKVVGPFSRRVREYADRAEAIVTCSEAAKRDIVALLEQPREKVHVVYGAADYPFQRADRPRAVDTVAQHYDVRQPYLLYLGTLEPRKNIEGMLRAFAQTARDVPHTFVLAGGVGWKMKGLDPLIESLGLRGRVKRIGYVRDPAHLPAFYAAADAFFFASHYEGFGLPALEAMTCGCPVILSNSSSLPEVGGSAAQYVDPADTAQMAATLLMVLQNDRLRETMASRGMEQAGRFSWDDGAARLLNLYRSMA